MKKAGQIFLGLGRRELLKWIPDKLYIQILFYLKTGEKLDLNHPKSFNAKLQWMKLNCRKPFYTQLADKNAVKDYISNVIGERYVIPTLAVWHSANDIDIDALPNQFVLKCNHDSGSVIICRDKSTFDLASAKKRLSMLLKHSGYWYGREWPYKDIKPCIIAEKYIDSHDTRGLMDYKFFCFNGEPKLLYVSVGLEHHPTAKISFYDLEGNEQPFHRSDYKPLGEKLSLPENYKEMEDIARTLAGRIDTPFVRIDLYSIDGCIYFSEITFYPCNGTLPFDPPEWDVKLGDILDIDEYNRQVNGRF